MYNRVKCQPPSRAMGRLKFKGAPPKNLPSIKKQEKRPVEAEKIDTMDDVEAEGRHLS